jgi:hypothetical protein
VIKPRPGPQSDPTRTLFVSAEDVSLAIGTYWFEVQANIGTNWMSANSPATAERVVAITTCL